VDAVTGGAIALPDRHVGLVAAVADNDGDIISEGAIDAIAPLRFSRHGEPASRLSRVVFRHATQVIGGTRPEWYRHLACRSCSALVQVRRPAGAHCATPRIDESARCRERERAAPAVAIETTHAMDGQPARAKEALLILTAPLAIRGSAVWPSKCGDGKAATHIHRQRASRLPGSMRRAPAVNS
jgi:hypothetical protein